MTIKEQFDALHSAYIKARSGKEKERIFGEIAALQARSPEEFADALQERAESAVGNARQLLFRESLSRALKTVRAKALAERIGKSPAWISQKLNGNTVNGTEAVFSPDDMRLITEAIHAISSELSLFEVVKH